MVHEYGFSLEYSSSDDLHHKREHVIFTSDDKLRRINTKIASEWVYFTMSEENLFSLIYFDGDGYLAAIGELEVPTIRGNSVMNYYTKLVAPTKERLQTLIEKFDLRFDEEKIVRGQD